MKGGGEAFDVPITLSSSGELAQAGSEGGADYP